HPKHPDTISDVIYARNQFTPVRNGMLKKALEGNQADASCYQAALEALTGVQPVGDKVFFRRVNGRSGQVIGHHVFY
ncbi:MAG: cell wall hydrolase, partial [Ruminococcus sp.]|nr:cell wall hydrolase [Ruminococcus sp.]